jgi:PAS domain S-box-containing protein
MTTHLPKKQRKLKSPMIVEQLLEDPQQLIENIIEGNSDVIFIKDLKGRYILINKAFCQTTKLEPEEVIGKTDAEIFPPLIASKFNKNDNEIITTKKQQVFDESETFGGVFRRFITTKSPFYDGQGNLTGILGIVHDVTELRRIEADQQNYQQKLEISESRFRKLFEESPIAIQILSSEGKIIHINQAWKTLWGITSTTSQTPSNPDLLSLIKKGLNGEATSTPTLLNLHPKKIESLIYPIKDRNDEVREVILMLRDVSERIQSETTLKLLAETSQLLETSLDFQATLEHISKIVVQWFGDWCEIVILGKENEIYQTAVGHKNPLKKALYKKHREKYPAQFDDAYGAGKVIKTGLSVFYPTIDENFLKLIIQEEAKIKSLLRLGLISYIGIPIKEGKETKGVITIASTQRNFTPQDLLLAQELGTRASLAIQTSKLYEEAKKAIQLRDDFLSIASHELKTPLTPLSLQIQSLKRIAERHAMGNYPAEKLVKLFESSASQVKSLTQLIEVLLDVSRITTGKLELNLEPLDLVKIVSEIIHQFSSQLKKVNCEITIDHTAEIHGLWDRMRVEQIISNLMTNAMKYGYGKPIQVKIWEFDQNAYISIQDAGIGIANEDQSRIFNRFERAVSVYQFGGMGLGLYVTREIIKAHGGSIEIQSQAGHGARFTVKLPIQTPYVKALREVRR